MPTRITSAQRFVEKAEQSVRDAVDAGAIWRTADAVPYEGRRVVIDGEHLLNFGGCSYMGLELRDELKEGAIDAIRSYGTQFSFSRTYLESPLYARLEALLTRMTGGYPLVAPSTSLGHISALPVLIGPGDAMILDRSAHASVHTAAALVRDATVARINHNSLEELAALIERFSRDHQRVWYLLDGLYSMLGDFAPLADIAALLDAYPKLHVYVDDAHSTSWCGKHGRGFALECLGNRARVVVALSLNKAFSAAGGALIFSSEAERTRVRMCGGPMVFSGPVQPPMLGAAVASAELHVSPEFADLQRALLERIDLTLAQCRDLDIPLASRARTPIFFVPCGASETAFELARQLRECSIYACVSAFPAVPENRAGVRFTVSLHNTEEDIGHLTNALWTALGGPRRSMIRPRIG